MVGKWMIEHVRTATGKAGSFMPEWHAWLSDTFRIWPASPQIIKRIATTSLHLSPRDIVYWLRPCSTGDRYEGTPKVYGSSSSWVWILIFIYLFFEIVGHRWFNEYIYTFTDNLFIFSHGLMKILGALVIFGLEWGVLLFLIEKDILQTWSTSNSKPATTLRSGNHFLLFRVELCSWPDFSHGGKNSLMRSSVLCSHPPEFMTHQFQTFPESNLRGILIDPGA